MKLAHFAPQFTEENEHWSFSDWSEARVLLLRAEWSWVGAGPFYSILGRMTRVSRLCVGRLQVGGGCQEKVPGGGGSVAVVSCAGLGGLR